VTSTACLELLHGDIQIIWKHGCTEGLALVWRTTKTLGQSHGLLAEELARSSEAVARRMSTLGIGVMMIAFLRIDRGIVMVRRATTSQTLVS
jgi:hypothetical protein